MAEYVDDDAAALAADPTIEHGQTRTYSYLGCRCPDCTTAACSYMAELRDRRYARRTTGPDGRPYAHTNLRGEPLPHGSVNTYREWGCRCPDCTAAAAHSKAAERTTRNRRDAPRAA